MPVTFSPRARRELTRAVAYYAGAGVAGRFRRAVGVARRRIAADPTGLPLCGTSDHVRRIRVKNFPDDLLFEVRAADVLILSAWHHHRNPDDAPA